MARENLAERPGEGWRPPPFRSPGTGLGGNVAAAIRRAVDLQAGSIWDDVRNETASARGAVLDVGCGAQPYRRLFPPGVSYRGLDDAAAEANFGYRMPDTEYFSGATWPTRDASADFILSTETLEHVFDVRTFLSEAFRTLRPGGSLVLTVPFAARWHYVPHDYWRFTPSCLRLLLEEQGFRQVEVHGRGNALTVACYKTMALFLPLILPQSKRWPVRWAMRACGLVVAPLFLLSAAVGNVSRRFAAGDDCLGYTVRCRRPAASA